MTIEGVKYEICPEHGEVMRWFYQPMILRLVIEGDSVE